MSLTRIRMLCVRTHMYIAHCTLHIVHCTLYIAYCTLYIVHCTLYIVHCTLYTVQCTLHIVHALALYTSASCNVEVIYEHVFSVTNTIRKPDMALVDVWSRDILLRYVIVAIFQGGEQRGRWPWIWDSHLY